MAANDKQFLKALGTRITELRKEQGLSQQALDRLGIAQQPLAHYEVGRTRMPVSLLPELARLFGVGTDELLSLRNGSGKRGPPPSSRSSLSASPSSYAPSSASSCRCSTACSLSPAAPKTTTPARGRR